MPVITRRRATLVLVALLAAVLALILIEVGYRVFFDGGADAERDRQGLRELAAHGHPTYEPRYYTSYGLNSHHDLRNSLGFWGPEWKRERTPGEFRILCMGGSTTEGGNPLGPMGAYPFYLEQTLEAETGSPVEVMNCGVSLWTTAESLANWFLLMQDYAPDAVILHHAVNDVEPRNSPGFLPDYRHWRVPFRAPSFGLVERFLIRSSDLYADWVLKQRPQTLFTMSTKRLPGPWPSVEGGLPAETAAPFRRNAESIGASVAGQGGVMCLMTLPLRPFDPTLDDANYRQAVEQHNQILRELAAEHGWTLIDAADRFPTFPGLDVGDVFLDLVHVKPEGNQAKAAMASAALQEAWGALPR